MRSRTLILGGLALCLGAFTWPAWRTLASAPPVPPDLARPAQATRCVAPTDYMRASHMVLLGQWREAVVRNGVRTYTAADGRTFRMSLTGTCLRQCHTDKRKFCDRCHDYADVRPTCWDCHLDGSGEPAAGSGQPAGVPRDSGSARRPASPDMLGGPRPASLDALRGWNPCE